MDEKQIFKPGEVLKLRRIIPHRSEPDRDSVYVEREGALFKMNAKYVCLPDDTEKTVEFD